MTNSEQLYILKQGPKVWNKWRSENLTVMPDFREAKLVRADLRGADLREANLRGADLREAKLGEADLREADLREAYLGKAKLVRANLGGADLREADLRGADLREAKLGEAKLGRTNLGRANLGGADLREADLREADLRGADLRGANLGEANLGRADLREADLRGANLGEANLGEADLREADLREAKLFGADLREAILKKTHFYSKFVLNNLLFPLSDEQILSAIFKDEEEKAQKGEFNTSKLSSLKIEIEGFIKWDLMDFGLFFMCLQKTYNNVLYLMTTDETNIKKIKEQLVQNKSHPGADNNIALENIQTGSWIIDILQSASQYETFITYMAVVTAAYTAASKALKLYKETLDIREQKIDIALKEENLRKKRLENKREEKKPEFPLAPTQELPVEIGGTLNTEIANVDVGQLENPVIRNNTVQLFSDASEPMVKIFIKLRHAGVKKIRFKLAKPKNN